VLILLLLPVCINDGDDDYDVGIPFDIKVRLFPTCDVLNADLQVTFSLNPPD